MKVPKQIKGYCSRCRKTNFLSVLQSRKQKASELKQGQRRFRAILKGYRGFPRPKPSSKKVIKKINLKYSCTKCNYSYYRVANKSKNFEFIK